MQPQINSIEYQLTSELAEKLALEEIELHLGIRQRFRMPILVGLLFAAFFLRFNYPFHSTLKIGNEDFSGLAKGISAFVVSAIGFFIGFGVVLFFRSCIRLTALRQARRQLNLGETLRKVSWDNVGLTYAAPSWEYKIKWRIVDKIVEGRFGIFVFVYGNKFFSLPKSILPDDLSVKQLMTLWSAFINQHKQPPVIKEEIKV